MYISISTGLYYRKNYIEILDIIKGTSFKNIELFLNQAFIDVPIKDIVKEVEKRDLRVMSIHTPLEFIAFERKEDEEFWIGKAIEMAKAFGAEAIVSHMVLGKDFKNPNRDLDKLHKENILRSSRNCEIAVTTENLPVNAGDTFLSRYDELLNFIRENKVNMTFDTTHCASYDKNIVDIFSMFKNHVKNIHLSDFKNGIEHKVLDRGELPIKSFIEYLKKIDYKGSLTLELDFDNKNRNDISNDEQAILELEGCYRFINNILND